MRFERLGSAADVAREAAGRVSSALRAFAGGGTFVLAGGGTPEQCYRLLAADPSIPWGRVTALFGDERCVPPDHPDSNYRMARAALLDAVGPASVHRIPGELGAEAAAARYGPLVEDLRPLDLVLLGVGEDGHTASLFPGSPALAAGGSAVAVHDAPKPPPDRVSLTLEVLREARQVLVLAVGAGKREAVARAARGEVPAGMIESAVWLVDEEAMG